MFLAVAVGACLVAAAEPAAKDPEQEFLREWRVKGQEMVDKLYEKSTWTDPKKQEILLSYLKLARRIRSQSPYQQEQPRGPDRVSVIRDFRIRPLVNLLLPHLTYSPNPPKKDSGKPPDLDKEYPVAGTLVALGSVAVPGLLDVLKSADPAARTGPKKRELTLLCLVAIYGEGGYGPQMARERIELEIKNTPAKERGFLGKALESPLLQKAERK